MNYRFIKLKALGYTQYECFSKFELPEIHFVKDKNLYDLFGSKMQKRMACDFIYIPLKNEWIKSRFKIPPLTKLEKVLYET